MKFPYAVRQYKKGYIAWTPFDHYMNGRGLSKVEAVEDLTKQFQESLAKVEGELGEIEI